MAQSGRATHAVDGKTGIDGAVAAIARGDCVIVMDDPEREGEGDLVMAARHATPARIAAMLRATTGILCAPMPPAHARSLGLPLMVENGQCPHGTAFTQSADARVGISTGVSATDRSVTLRRLADACTAPSELVRPGHVFPLVAHERGLAARRGHTEAGVALCELAGIRPPVAAVCELVDVGTHEMLRLPGCLELAHRCGMPIVTVDEIAAAVSSLVDPAAAEVATAAAPALAPPSPTCGLLPAGPAVGVRCVASCIMPVRRGGLNLGRWTVQVWSGPPGSHDTDATHIITLAKGDVRGGRDVLVRVHSECFTGDVFASALCDCGSQLTDAIVRIAECDAGVVVYVRGHEGRGIGIAAKIRAYRMQAEEGVDTYAANIALGYPADGRRYDVVRAILSEGLGIGSVRLITNNPAKADGLAGLVQSVVKIRQSPNDHNARYLSAKHAAQVRAAARSPHAALFEAS